jgi:ABC-type transporter Mla subunit MlaD
MNTLIGPALRSIRKHHVLTELILIGFAVVAFVIGVMLGLPGDGDETRRGYAVTVEATESPAEVESAGS